MSQLQHKSTVDEKAPLVTTPHHTPETRGNNTSPASIFFPQPGPYLNVRPSFPGMGIPMLKIRRSQDRLIFNMGLPILVRRHLYIKTAPCN